MIGWRTIMSSVLCACILTAYSNLAIGAERNKSVAKLGKDTYMSNCEACHMMGKNVIKPGKDIVISSKLASIDEFKSFISEEHGLMPSFKSIAEDTEVVEALYKFTKKLKNQSWQYEPPLKDTPPDPSPRPQKKKEDKNARPTG